MLTLARRFKNSVIVGGVELVNLTTKPIHILTTGGFDPACPEQVVEIRPEGIIPSVQVKEREVNEIGGIPLVKYESKNAVGLPEQHEGVFYIVDTVTAQCMKGRRWDLIVPIKPEKRINDKGEEVIVFTAFATFISTPDEEE